MKSFLLVLAAMMFTTGCATTGKYEEKLQSWVGNDSDNLIAVWGVPTQTMAMNNGGTLIEYNKVESSEAHYNSYTKTVTAYTYWCNTRFVVNSSKKVATWAHEGNNCRSR